MELGDYEGMLAELNAPRAKVFPVLQGKVAIVTGVGQGMGKATALTFAEAGASVVCAEINAETGARTVAELTAAGHKAHFVRTDISKADDVQHMVQEAVRVYGKLDVAVNNAALSPDAQPIGEFDEDHWDTLMAVNLKGTALCTKYQIRQMVAQGGGGGSIVNIASVNAFKPALNMVAYTSAKHAIVGLSKQAALEYGPHGIRVNTVCPGAVLTEMSAKALIIMGGDAHQAYAKKINYLQRWAAPHEIAQASLWLASDAASFVTGTAVPVDAGHHVA